MLKIFLGITIVFLTLNECFSSPNQIHARPSKSSVRDSIFFQTLHSLRYYIYLKKKEQRHRPQFKFEKSSIPSNDNNEDSSQTTSSPTKMLNAQNSDKCPKLIKNKPCEYDCSIEKENDCGGKLKICVKYFMYLILACLRDDKFRLRDDKDWLYIKLRKN
jgi:hypothetical protein